MAALDRPDRAPPGGIDGAAGQDVIRDHRPHPRALAEALRDADSSLDDHGAGSETPSEEDYDVNVRPALASRTGAAWRKRRSQLDQQQQQHPHEDEKPAPSIRRTDSGIHIFSDDDASMQELLQRSSQRVKNPQAKQRTSRFSRLVFTHQFSAFDRNNEAAASSPFHGFYTLFWLSVGLMIVKISADNWRRSGSILGSNDIMKTMFHRDGESPCSNGKLACIILI